MFRASLCPSSEDYQLQQQPLVYRRNVVVTVLFAVVGPSERTDHGKQHCYHQIAASSWLIHLNSELLVS
jgi:hypothetical protein